MGWNPRAWSGLNPSWPCRTTANFHPGPGVPSAASGTNIVMYREAWLAWTDTVPSDCPAASTKTGLAKPWTSIRLLHAEPSAIA